MIQIHFNLFFSFLNRIFKKRFVIAFITICKCSMVTEFFWLTSYLVFPLISVLGFAQYVLISDSMSYLHIFHPSNATFCTLWGQQKYNLPHFISASQRNNLFWSSNATENWSLSLTMWSSTAPTGLFCVTNRYVIDCAVGPVFSLELLKNHVTINVIVAMNWHTSGTISRTQNSKIS